MPFNINAFKFEVDTYSYLKTNAFEVYVFTPPVLRDFELNNGGSPISLFSVNRHLKMRIEQVSIPGVSLQTVDVKRYGVGTVQKMPVGALSYGDVTFSILLDGFGEIYHFWEAWIRKIYEHNGVSSSSVNDGNAFASYVTEYKDQITTDMQIVVYDQFGNAIQKINLKEAFPVAMKDIPLSWGSEGLMRLQVTVAYTEHTIDRASLLEIIAQQGVNFAVTGINRAITS